MKSCSSEPKTYVINVIDKYIEITTNAISIQLILFIIGRRSQFQRGYQAPSIYDNAYAMQSRRSMLINMFCSDCTCGRCSHCSNDAFFYNEKAYQSLPS